ncbi:MAG: hypothetical protein B9S32_03800 [Verrucomicrobia bacterium Tous-C9LFEB]|nr:MAG: hypothetical protein B9S32_03800 [Verrucomicrobia bacterium Tous-C9LFEB]
MKFSALTGLILGLIVLLGTVSLEAGVLLQEDFTYANGGLNGKNGGTGWNGAWSVGTNGTGTWSVADGTAGVSGDKDTWATRNLATPIISSSLNTFYFSFSLQVTAYSTPTQNIFDVIRFTDSGTNLFMIGAQYTAAYNGYRIRVQTGNGVDTSLTPTSTSTNTPTSVVGKYTFDDGTGKASLTLWINPVNESSTPQLLNYSWTSTAAEFDRLMLQRYNSSGATGSNVTSFDSFLVGTDWTSVTVPEPSTTALLSTVGMASLAMWVRRKR